jgi:hypothetical protein
MSFRAERKRLRDTLQPGEEILARDPLCTIDERPELTVLAHPVLVVTDRSIYLILSGKEQEITAIALDALVGVERTDDPVPGSTLRLTMPGDQVLTLTYEPRSRRQDTADRITERFFGRVVKDTSEETPPSDP